MSRTRFTGATALAAAALATCLMSASAVAATDPCAAHTPTLTQQFLSVGDTNLYTLAPGGGFSSPTAGWQLTGGASIIQTTQYNGTTGGVLDMPSKSQAVSPVMCITADYPTARLQVRNLKGSEGVFFHVSYLKNGVWTSPKNTGQFHGKQASWTLSNPMNVQPSSTPGWQQVRFTFITGGNTSRFQVDEFWVDPRAR